MKVLIMSTINILGIIGVTWLLAAYFLNLTGKVKSSDLSYILLNFLGAITACISSILMKFYPFVVLEGVWTIVSIWGLYKYYFPAKLD